MNIRKSIPSKAQTWINQLALEPHPEGGFYKRSYQCAKSIHSSIERPLSSAIYYLLIADQYSAFHRIDADEMWHFYDGSPLTIHVLTPEAGYYQEHLNSNGNFQVLVPAHHWFAAEITNHQDYTLVGCTVTPGFDFSKFELADPKILAKEYDNQAGLIARLCV